MSILSNYLRLGLVDSFTSKIEILEALIFKFQYTVASC